MQERAALDIKAGDTLRVFVKVEEKGKTRLQPFEGLVLAHKHGSEAGATFTVRKVTNGVGVEKIFPLYSPLIDKIEIVKRAKVRRSKLYYIREKAAREIRRQMRNSKIVDIQTEGDIARKERLVREEEEAEAAKQAAEAPVEENVAEVSAEAPVEKEEGTQEKE